MKNVSFSDREEADFLCGFHMLKRIAFKNNRSLQAKEQTQ